jgi:3-methyladenine DNA glycosylase AlkD
MNNMNEKEAILAQIRQTLTNNKDEERAFSHDRFFKEETKSYGLKVSEARKIAKEFWQQIKDEPKQTIFEMCEELWKSGYMEEIVIACVFSEALHKQYEPADFSVFERWISLYVNNWADCDTLCPHTVGDFVMMYPNYVQELKRWANSENRWLRRAAAVTLIIPARKGLFLNDILEIADMLLLDQEDLVQKGYGWMLKAASMSETFVKGSPEIKKQHLDAVFHFVMKNKAAMPRTALRYAIEKMPENLKAEAMKK